MRLEHGTWFSRVVREQLFAPSDPERRLVGLSLELVPLRADSGRVSRIDAQDGLSSAQVLRECGRLRGWREQRSPAGEEAGAGPPRFFTPGACTLRFQPGGQIELVVPACSSIGDVLRLVRQTVEPLRDTARRHGLELFSCGIDPVNNVIDVPLQRETAGDVTFARYLDTLGPSGARLTRQGAGLAVHLDGGRSPGRRWRLLNDLAPYLTAIFANSRRYAGLDTGLQSYRAYCRRTLDPSRTGVPVSGGDPRDAYLEFALDAIDPMRRVSGGRYVPYRDWIAIGEWSPESWDAHLATLFPEVRPRGHLEVAAVDAVPLRWLAAPVVLTCGLVYHERSASEAAGLLAEADDALLWRAAAVGLHDEAIASVGRDLALLGLRGAERLGDAYVPADLLAVTREYVEQYTLRARSLADDAPAPRPTPCSVPRLVVLNRAVTFGRPG